jgi:hypothetical protein
VPLVRTPRGVYRGNLRLNPPFGGGDLRKRFTKELTIFPKAAPTYWDPLRKV